MTIIHLGGIFSPTAITLAAAGDSSTLTSTLNTSVPQFSDTAAAYALYDGQSRICEPLSFTVEGSRFWNGQDWGAGFHPGILSRATSVQSVAGNKVVVAGLDAYSSYMPALYAGATVEFRRISNGQMVRAASGTVTSARFMVRDRTGTSTTTAISGTSYHFKFSNWNGANLPYWFSVCAVRENGDLGPVSQWISHTPTSVQAASTPTNTFVTTARQSGTTTDLAAPGGVSVTSAADGLADITWQPVTGAVGYVLWLAYNDPATWPDNDGELTLSGLSGTPMAGDMLIWRREIMALNDQIFCPRVTGDANTYRTLFPGMVQSGTLNRSTDTTGYTVREWNAEAPPASGMGRYYLRRKLQAGATTTDGIYWSCGPASLYYHQKKAGDVFVLDVWLRADRATTLQFTSGQPGEPRQSVSVGTEWAHHQLTSDYIGQTSGGTAYRWELRASAGSSPLQLDIAQLRPHLQGTDYGAVQPQIATGLIPGQRYRDHQLIKTNPRTYSAKVATNPAGEGYKGWTCGMHLDICAQYNLMPWTQIEWAWPKEDWLLWADWLATHYPDLDRIMLELGNENWNVLSSFWTTPSMVDAATGTTLGSGAVYGLTCRMVRDWLMESPHWNWLSTRIDWVIGGWLISAFGEEAYARFPEAKHINVANYNGGWDVEATTPEETGQYFRSMTAFQGAVTRLDQRSAALQSTAATLGKTVGTDVFHDFYEAGPGYQLNGLNNASLSTAQAIVQECVKKSRASATSQLDTICLAWERGWLSNYFRIGIGDYWQSHREDGTEFLPYTVGRTISERLGLFRAHETYPLHMPTQDGVEDIGIYAFESISIPGRWMYVALNRGIDHSVLPASDPLYGTDTGARAVTIHTPHTSATGCRVFLGGIGNMRAHNRYPTGTRFTTAGTYEADPLCIAFDTGWHDWTVPENPGQLQIDTRFGAGADGLRGGNFLMIELSETT